MTGLRTDRIPKAVADELWPAAETNNGKDNNVQERTVTLTANAARPGQIVQDAVKRAVDRVNDNSESQDAEFKIPNVVFGDFQDAPELKRLARDLADEYEGNPRVNDVLWHSEGCEIRYAWKQKGGKSQGRSVLGKCVKLSGPAKHFAQGADFLIWVAWDHARNLDLSRKELMALLFHELHHIQRDVTDDDEDVYSLRSHDLEVFIAEIEVFGAWQDDLERGKKAFEQLGLGV